MVQIAKNDMISLYLGVLSLCGITDLEDIRRQVTRYRISTKRVSDNELRLSWDKLVDFESRGIINNKLEKR